MGQKDRYIKRSVNNETINIRKRDTSLQNMHRNELKIQTNSNKHPSRSFSGSHLKNEIKSKYEKSQNLIKNSNYT